MVDYKLLSVEVQVAIIRLSTLKDEYWESIDANIVIDKKEYSEFLDT